jgi:hypothetical protein
VRRSNINASGGTRPVGHELPVLASRIASAAKSIGRRPSLVEVRHHRRTAANRSGSW